MKESNRSASIPVVRSVINALRVVEALAQSQPLSVAELGRKVDLPKSTVFRALITLESGGWAEASSTPAAEWSLTNRVFELGLLSPRNAAPLEAAVAALTELRDEYRETCALLVPSGGDLIVIAREDGTNALRAYIELGAKVSLASTASGRAYLSALPPDEARRLLRSHVTTDDPDSYEERVWLAVQEATKRGFAVDDGSDPFGRRSAVVVGGTTAGAQASSGGVAGVAAPVVTAQGVVKGVITITMPSAVASTVDLSQIGLRLSALCARLGESRV